MELGKRISLYRKQLKMNQTDLAKKIESTQSYVSQLERGDYTPTMQTIRSLAKALNVSVSDLMDDGQQTDPLVAQISQLIAQERDENPDAVSTLLKLIDSDLLRTRQGLDALNNLLDLLDTQSRR